MWTFVIIVVGLWFIWAVFKKLQEKERHEVSSRTEDEILAQHQKARSRIKAKITGAALGGFLGSFIGIAGFGGAIAGAIPCAIVGWLISGNTR
jgi:outer membrane lipoprotein SlyB